MEKDLIIVFGILSILIYNMENKSKPKSDKLTGLFVLYLKNMANSTVDDTVKG